MTVRLLSFYHCAILTCKFVTCDFCSVVSTKVKYLLGGIPPGYEGQKGQCRRLSTMKVTLTAVKKSFKLYSFQTLGQT